MGYPSWLPSFDDVDGLDDAGASVSVIGTDGTWPSDVGGDVGDSMIVIIVGIVENDGRFVGTFVVVGLTDVGA
jgi:hypothetical protein